MSDKKTVDGISLLARIKTHAEAALGAIGAAIGTSKLGKQGIKEAEDVLGKPDLDDAVKAGGKAVTPGKITGDKSALSLSELKVAEELAAEGRQVEIVPRGSNPAPDFIIDGKPTELKTLSTVKNTTIGGLSKAITTQHHEQKPEQSSETAIEPVSSPSPAENATETATAKTTDFLVEWTERKRRRAPFLAEAMSKSKTEIFGVCEANGIATIEVNFDGQNDNGQIEYIEAFDQNNANLELPKITILLWRADFEGTGVTIEEVSFESALESICYAHLSDAHSGWDNDDGASGTFTFDAATRTISLEHRERFVTEEISHETL
jgi:hypothetical protein